VERAVVIVGAAGEVMTVAVKALAMVPGLKLSLVDRDAKALRLLTDRLPGPARAGVCVLDLNDRPSLRSSIVGADLVLNGAGPFDKTALPVAQACLTERVDYLDIGDEIGAAVALRAFDAESRSSGVNVLMGCGVSPGLTNLLARDLIDRFDASQPVDVDVAWLVGDEGEQHLGRAVLDHAIQMVSGSCLTWRDSKATSIPSFRQADLMPYGTGIGMTRQWELAHPEVVTLPWHYPALRSVRCFGGLRPVATNGLLRGLGEAVHRGTLDLDRASQFLGSVLAGGNGNLAGWSAARDGMRDQIRRGELTKQGYRKFWTDSLLKRHEPFVGGFLARVSGTIAGRPATLVRRSGPSGPGTSIPSMAHITGSAAAAFSLLALTDKPCFGAMAPEGWATVEKLAPHLVTVGLADNAIGPLVAAGDLE
jgi:Saccharopine dehydrogenase NADP binding domain